MSQKIACDRDGAFRGTIQEYGLKEFPSGAVAIKYRADLEEIYNFDTESWHPCSDWDMEVYGDCFVVKKDGSLNTASVSSLVDHAGWDGQFKSIQDATWEPTPCQFSVKRSEYEGKVYFNAAFINGFDDTPGGGALPMLEPAKVSSLDAKFGSAMRVLTANKMRNQTAPPAGAKPPAPPKPAAKEPPKVHAATGDDIPFAMIGFLLSLATLSGLA